MEERKILRHLRLNSRKSLAKIGRECNIPASSAYNEVNRIEQSFVSKYTSLLDFNRLGLYARAHLIIGVDRGDRKLLSEFLGKCPNVNSVYRLRGEHDFYVDAVFKHELEVNDFVKRLKADFAVKEVVVHHILKEVQSEMFLVK
jgi:DNA-binding Lrp family transcriptional regulator